MARKLRLQFAGAVYLLTNHGNRDQSIVHDDLDRQLFVDTLGHACAKTDWHVHAYCLLPDHFHLLVQTPQPNVVSGMKWFLGTYTARFNRRHGVRGHVFAGRYRALLIGPHGPYFRTAGRYIHTNPGRARLIPSADPLAAYPWSSYPAYLEPTQRPPWLHVQRLLADEELADAPADRGAFAARLEALRHGQSAEDFRTIRRGWCYGDDPFRQTMLREISQLAGENHTGPELAEAAEAKANRIVEEELRAALWTEAELIRRRKGDPQKLAIATRLRAETTVTLQWIASRLRMGTKTHLSHLLYWQARGEAPPPRTPTAKPSRPQDAAFVSPRSARSTAPHGSAAVQPADSIPARPSPRPKSPRPTPDPEAAAATTSDRIVESTPLPRSDPFQFDPSFD